VRAPSGLGRGAQAASDSCGVWDGTALCCVPGGAHDGTDASWRRAIAAPKSAKRFGAIQPQRVLAGCLNASCPQTMSTKLLAFAVRSQTLPVPLSPAGVVAGVSVDMDGAVKAAQPSVKIDSISQDRIADNSSAVLYTVSVRAMCAMCALTVRACVCVP
jgi:hypothetical protein